MQRAQHRVINVSIASAEVRCHGPCEGTGYFKCWLRHETAEASRQLLLEHDGNTAFPSAAAAAAVAVVAAVAASATGSAATTSAECKLLGAIAGEVAFEPKAHHGWTLDVYERFVMVSLLLQHAYQHHSVSCKDIMFDLNLGLVAQPSWVAAELSTKRRP